MTKSLRSGGGWNLGDWKGVHHPATLKFLCKLGFGVVRKTAFTTVELACNWIGGATFKNPYIKKTVFLHEALTQIPIVANPMQRRFVDEKGFHPECTPTGFRGEKCTRFLQLLLLE